MKRFFSFWIVSLVFAALAGLFAGLIEYFTAATVQGTYGPCVDTILGGCFYDPIEIFGMYPLVAFLWMIVIYPIFRAIVGSFKVVFSESPSE